MYLLIHLLGRAQLEAVRKGLWCPSRCWPEQRGWGQRAAPAGGLPWRWQVFSRLQQGFPGPCSAPLQPVPSRDMFYLHLLKHCL